MPSPPQRWSLLFAASPLLVFLALAVFAYPSTDDWAFRCQALHAGVAAGTLDHLAHWGGRFAVIPLNLGIHVLPAAWLVYPTVIAANLGLLVVSVRLLLPRGSPASWAVAAAGGAMLAVTLPSPVQGLYWLCGMLAYCFPLHLAVIAIALMRRWTERPGWRLDMAIAAIGLLVAGFGETVAGLLAASAALLALGGWRRSWWLLAGTLTGIAAAMLMPGTWQRLAVAHQDGSAFAAAGAMSAGLSQVIRLILHQAGRPEVWCAALGAAVLGANHGRRIALPAAWLVLGAVPLACALALAPSFAALGMVEGRQLCAVWLMLIVWSLVLAWDLGARHPDWFIGVGRRPGMRLGIVCLLLACAITAIHDAEALRSLLLGIPALVIAGIAAVALLRSDRPAWLAIALGAFLWTAGSTEQAGEDLLIHAPHRRAEQATRDRAVRDLAAAGARHVRFPAPDPRHFPETISMGDLINAKDWASVAYAGCFGVETAGSDVRLTATVATDAAGRPLVPAAAIPPRLKP